MAKIRINHRILNCNSREIEFSGEAPINLSDDTVFQFLSEEYEGLSPASSFDENEEEDTDEKENQNDNEIENLGAKNDNFWESQFQLLQSTICRTSSLESRIRNITKEALNETQNPGNLCTCGKPVDQGCRKCRMEEVCRRLQIEGFNTAICKTKWKSSSDIPSGEHTFLDVVDNSNAKKGEVRVIIELISGPNRDGRASEEYNKLVKRLPEIFVGKIERLLVLLKIMCTAAKKCMKEKKMHLGPWRKHRYMQAKWLRSCQRLPVSQPFSSSARPIIPKPSVDFVDNFSNLHIRPTVEVV
ncbi:hypothetical protein MIMGU_mgv1a010863mg [Erythranthe guttata]|uniref:Uncharacterized protein n=1 Tax=Erythranthe guttata TaxID=4155 RepID=A0A022QL64_ERYGU|nr:PREDICTED: uncharacterized protein LOC105968810 [Erythranthe guttata]EYU27978.1 hypothetical protein MIMGU_mgv1a010863mg [Erythranthe guttata]|eukprot:XP_012848937.1 PREDICTED: uncharacterized protein LOC105968810 [Erythranthe guttata]